MTTLPPSGVTDIDTGASGRITPLLKKILRPAISIVLLGVGIGLVGYYYGFDNVLGGFEKLSPTTIGLVAISLFANALAAALRFKVVAAQTGHPVRFRHAMTTVGASTLAGVLFFQFAGQLMARGFMMRRTSMPFAAVVVVTLYERVVAAILSGLIALGGAVYIFGKIYIDQDTGGLALIKIICGLAAATIAAGLLGYGRAATQALAPFLTQHFARSFLRIIGLTLLVQAPMMTAYVIAAHALSPAVSVAELVAASAIVMFAASVPISLAGWGVREMSAIVALGFIGVAANTALTVAVLIGAGSMLSMALLAACGWSRSEQRQPAAAIPVTTQPIDFMTALAWCLPIAASILVLFQIYVPIGSGLLNVNLADPVALLAGALFIVRAVQQRQWPQWRLGYLNLSVAAMTLALGASLLIGASRFGWTDWALINRFFGWFVLLAFAATGALIVNVGGHAAFRIMLLSYVGAIAAVVLLEISLVAANAVGADLPHAIIVPDAIEAFSQNHNFFAFQLLMATAAMLVIVRRQNLRIMLLAAMLAAFWFAGSRSGWISIACVLAASVWLRVATIREIALALGGSACIAVILTIGVPALFHIPAAGPGIIPTEASTEERMMTLVGGWKLFLGHPIFGAGLGAFRHQDILATSGIPLVIHSTALWLLAELGAVGFLIFAISGTYVSATEWLRARRESDPASAVIALCIVGFAIMSGPADMIYQRTFWLLMGTALALPRRQIGKEDASAELQSVTPAAEHVINEDPVA